MQEYVVCKLDEISLRDQAQLLREGFEAEFDTVNNLCIARREL